ncbi:MAG TPA: APC family permease [Chloroflexota bacterium]|nr:APC family permease [Chloroflexota bacterium]
MDLRVREVVRGSKPGSHYIRVTRNPAFDVAGKHLVAREELLKPKTGFGRLLDAPRRLLIGARIPTEQEIHERVSVLKGLAVFASDNISSSAYASEAIMAVLVLAGTGALGLTLPITVAIVAVLAIVVTSYQQTLQAYPNGGGSYIVASDNLGAVPGLIAAGALLTDYILTVAVSIAAGVEALTSIFSSLYDWRVWLGIAFLCLICVGNLRGIRESATIFATPTYVYLLAIFGLLAYGLFRYATGTLPAYIPPPQWYQGHATQALGIVLILRAFAEGSVALTGVEAVSNGIPAFKPPESHHARIVLILMGSFFGSIFLGMSFLSSKLGILPDPTEQVTVVSQLAAVLVGNGSPYHYLVQISTALLLVLAANTAFSDFPRLSSILARNGYMPHQFAHRGDRLAFNMGIVVLGAVAAVLLVVFQGSVASLIPLYTVGVFIAFTLSQSGMVRHWWRLRAEERGWRRRALINGVGACTTAVVACVVGVVKFQLGAWIVLLIIPLFIVMMLGIRRHYDEVERLTHQQLRPPLRYRKIVIIPIAKLDSVSEQTLAFARSIVAAGDDLLAVHVALDVEKSALLERWEREGRDMRLVCIESPYRALTRPLLAYIDAAGRSDPEAVVTVILPEFVPRHWYEHLLHNHSALGLKAALLFRPRTVVVSVPYWPEATATERLPASSRGAEPTPGARTLS